jgi:hypothetical protein
MKINVDWTQPSTQRGIIWAIFGLVGLVFSWFGKDTSSLLPIFTAMLAAGAHGVAVDDDKQGGEK